MTLRLRQGGGGGWLIVLVALALAVFSIIDYKETGHWWWQ